MAKAKNAKTLSIHIQRCIAEEIEKRAMSMGWSISQYAAFILQDWYSNGAKAINSIDAAVNTPKKKS